ncbi:transglutaminase-like cysteine peptidase [Desulfovibrio sp. OttesenSCG-928-A18]|nr:transglutaminase-like cysteine peptidase [Desulfovibrio sp. OttesenSCG-928-A18]
MRSICAALKRWNAAAVLLVVLCLQLIGQPGAWGGGRYGEPLRFDPPPVDLNFEGMGVQPKQSDPYAPPPQDPYAPPPRVPYAPAPPAPDRPARKAATKPAAAPQQVQPPQQAKPSQQAGQDRSPAVPGAVLMDSGEIVRDDAQASPGPSPGQQAPQPAQTQARPSAGPQQTAGVPQAPAGKKPIRLFGTVEFRMPIEDVPKWETVRENEGRRPSFLNGGADVSSKKVAERWAKLREKLADAPLNEKVRGVNVFFNRWPYRTDREVWGVEDYWATPREFMQRSGDCEDYAIAKYYALRDLGVPKEILRIAAIKDTILNVGHAVTIVYMDDDAYVLDNLSNLVLSHSELDHYDPVFTVNEEFLWRHVRPRPRTR